MKISGDHKADTDIANLWMLLQDEEVLARISPGISRIDKISEDHYKAISDINIGPVRGSFEGELRLKDKIENETMTLELQQKSKIGNAIATIVMKLTPDGENAAFINYQGSAKVSGRLATMGQRILGGVIKTLSKQVFSELDKVIEEQGIKTVSSPTDVSDDTLMSKEMPSSDKSSESTRKSFFQLIIDKILSIWK